MHALIRPLALAALALGGAGAAAGCAAVEPRAGFDEVSQTIEDQTTGQVFWRTGGPEDEAADEAVQSLLAEPLTADAAAQVALLNNRHLQATYEELGVAQADLVQAGLLSNPVFSGSVTFPLDGGAVRPSMGVAQSFLDVFFVPLRERITTADLSATQQRVAEEVIAHAARTRAAIYRVQADKQAVEMLEQVTAATAGPLEMMHRLHEAGNMTDLDLHREQALYEQARIALEEAEAALELSRERATVVMGLWGEQLAWEAEPRLPELPEQEVAIDALEAEILLAATGQARLAAASWFCAWAGLVTAWIAAVLGWLFGGFDLAADDWLFATHRWLGTATAIWALVLLWALLRTRPSEPVTSRTFYRVALTIAALLVGAAGVFGGALVWGLDHYTLS